MSNATKHFSQGEFDQFLVANPDKVIVVDFFAPWCTYCQMAGPVLEDLAREYHGQALFAKVDIDEAPEDAIKYDAQSIPTVLLFKKGAETDRIVGFPGKAAYENALKEVLK